MISDSNSTAADGHTTPLSPPPIPGSSWVPPEKRHIRLRSDSGLALHTNQSAFRQYTDYGSDGSIRPASRSTRPLSLDGISTFERLSIGSRGSADIRVEFKDPFSLPAPSLPGSPLPRFFDSDVIKMAFSNPETALRMCRFAQGRNCGADMEFLLKVDEYSHALGSMTSLVSQISTKFTDVTATTPVDLPLDLSNTLRLNVNSCARHAVPPLEKLYRDARISVERRLARDLYPEFVKHQLAQCLANALSVSQSSTDRLAYPGLGSAFCLTDPHKTDNPIMYASDGMVEMSGYDRQEIVGKNCRLLQGISTDRDAVRRMGKAISQGQEMTELIVNHRKDGSAFWNFLFVCPLYENGSMRCHLGAQINVSENMGIDDKDVMRILNFSLPSEETSSGRQLHVEERQVQMVAVAQEETPETPEKRSHRTRFFQRFSRKSIMSSIFEARKGISEEQTPPPPTPPPTRVQTPTPTKPQFPQLERRTSDMCTPYSRFLVLRYTPDSTSVAQSDNRNPAPFRMSVAFCSAAALELLGLQRNQAAVVLDQDIFTVLVDKCSSPNIKSIKTTVTDKTHAGEAVSADLLVASPTVSAEPYPRASMSVNTRPQPPKHSKHRRNSSFIIGRSSISLARATALPAAARASMDLLADAPPRASLTETFDRGSEMLSNMLPSNPRMRRLVGHWTPLKDSEGKVGYVVLILTPAAS
ncbi:hypothetical protein QBC46DRAFT_313963 [Diplogelasinospora grovesii]|uniref:PAS domain-containing protein n=1 Tax=Diplogelasinospora grovesii TaxID=303347 RepID=A0AAN6S3Y9_9PEZI|nr:hypothetical protein QBC46DRAFT_313963 [Diplogelasinospora grovesii]